MTYNTDYFLNKFEAIPEGNWLTNAYASHDNSKCCALGWCNERTHKETLEARTTLESLTLRRLFRNELNLEPSWVNDDMEEISPQPYKQVTPKQRILAALRDIKAKEQPAVKEVVRYITVDAAVRELQKAELPES